MSELNYQANPEELETSFEPVPADDYFVIIEDSDYVDNKAGTGRLLKFTYQIIEGPMKGRKLFENLNLENQNQLAEKIARQSLNSICVACGVPIVQDTAQLHNIPFKITVKMKDDPVYGLGNVIRKHVAIDDKSESKPAKSPETVAAPKGGAKSATVAKKKHPWEK
jgi:hypothetical protein